MKAIFLTSYIGGCKTIINGNNIYKEIVKCDNSNGFIDKLKEVCPKINKMTFVASNPDSSLKTDEHANITKDSLNLDGFEIKELTIIDHSFVGDIEKTILSSDMVFLAGGNVPMQNKYFKEIHLKQILQKYTGILIGQSAGSMNCSDVVYTQPEEVEEFDDVNYKRIISGLGVVGFAIMPHINSANEIDEYGHPSVMQMCLKDSYQIPHYGICDYGFIEIINHNAVAYGKTYLINNGVCKQICDDGQSVAISKLSMH